MKKTFMNKKFHVNIILPVLLAVPVILSYLDVNLLLKLYNTLILSFGIILYAKKYIRINSIVVLLFVNALIGILIIPLYDNYGHNDYLHIVSYLFIVLGAYYFSIKLIKESNDILFKNLICTYFLIIFVHHLFVYLGVGEGTYFWDVNFITQRQIENAVFSNIGNGKNLTILITVFALISTWLSNLKMKFKVIINIILITFGVLSFSRALIFVAIIAFILYEIYRIKILHKKDYYILFPLLVIVIVSIAVNFELIALYLLREDFANLDSISRVQQFKEYVALISDHLYIGTGWSDFDSKVETYLTVGRAEVGGIIFLVEQGIIRGGIFIGLIFLGFLSIFFIDYKKLSNVEIGIYIISIVSVFVGIVWGNNIAPDIRAFIFWIGVFNLFHLAILKNDKVFLIKKHSSNKLL